MKYLFYSLLTIILLLTSCLKEHEYIPTEQDINTEINEWIYSKMYYYYYWNNEMPSNLSFSTNPDVFFKSLLFKAGEEDRFSWITDNAKQNYDMLHGINESFGFEYALAYQDTLKNQLYGIVLYVLPNTPASKNNIRRGDVFFMIDNIKLDNYNYNSFLSKKEALYTFINDNKEEYSTYLMATVIEENPIYYKNVYKIDNTKIGYLVYNLFTKDPGNNTHFYFDELLSVFSSFQEDNITEFILDLRYNSGGLIDLVGTFSSLIVPEVDTTKIALEVVYNNKIMESLSDSDNATKMKFSYIPESYIGKNLKRIYIIVGHSTASASEALINCLKAYMPVILIGTTTYGKNVGSIMFTDEDNHSNWAIQPIILKMFNSNGESNYTKGFSPDIQINEFNYALKEFGNLEEPLLNKAIESILRKSNFRLSGMNNGVSVIYNSLDRKHNLPVSLN